MSSFVDEVKVNNYTKLIDISDWIDLNLTTDQDVSSNSIILSPNHIKIANEWNEAMKSIGYCVITGHNISSSLLNQLNSEMRSFFDLSLDQKFLYNHGYYGHPNGGYTPPGVESVARSNTTELTSNRLPDPVENFVYCTYPKKFVSKDEMLFSPINSSQEYYIEMEKLLQTIHQLSAYALKLDNLNFFNYFYFHSKNNELNGNALRLSHYIPKLNRAQSISADSFQDIDNLLYGEHTDYQGFTILYPDPNDWNDEIGSQGLQLYDNNKSQWINSNINSIDKFIKKGDVYNFKDLLVINAGDLIQRWTNNYWKSPLHRVLGPKRNSIASTLSRYAIVYFTGPYESAMIHSLLIEGNDQIEILYEPILSGNHLKLKLNLSNV